MCVQVPARDQWAGTWPCQYSWSLCVFSQCNHGDGAMQTGCLHWGFWSHNVATALSFIMPWVTVSGQQMDMWQNVIWSCNWGLAMFPLCRIFHFALEWRHDKRNEWWHLTWIYFCIISHHNCSEGFQASRTNVGIIGYKKLKDLVCYFQPFCPTCYLEPF